MTALIVLGMLTLARILDLQMITSVRLHGFDLEQHLAPRLYQASPLRIVTIDENSLERYGQWPWPRTLVAQLVGKIAAGKPRVLGVDIIFAEHDRFSPARLAAAVPSIPQSIARQLASLPGNDAALAAAFHALPAVLGEGMNGEGAPGNDLPSAKRIRQLGVNPRPFLFSYPGRLRSLMQLREAASGRGELVAQPDSDGVLRRMPLFVTADNSLLPALSLEMLRVAFKADSAGILTATDGVHDAMIGNWLIPTDRRARAYPYFTHFPERVFLSAADLLDGSSDPNRLSGRIVLLGVTALGLVDQKQTPLGLMSGVETQAQLTDSILTRNLLRRPSTMDLTEVVVVLAAGLFTIFALPYRRPAISGLAFAALVVLILGGAFGSFHMFRLLFDGAYPAFGLIVVYGVMLQANSRAAEAARRQLASDLVAEREREAHLQGELGAARAIQMGLLPRRFPAFPDRKDLDIYAAIEPARVVGGDLYDYVLPVPGMLSFTIADVSGEGVPAALFMATIKGILRAGILRHGPALDRAIAEANAEISSMGAEMTAEGANLMFVTVFAGVLDLTSGRLVYVNAGHPSPLVLKPGAKPYRLTGTGGPPLGAVEDYAYPVEQQRLAPGELVLLYTDGVTDAENPTRSFYGNSRLENLLGSAAVTDAKAIVDLVLGDLRRFADGAEQADDIALLAVRWLGAKHRSS